MGLKSLRIALLLSLGGVLWSAPKLRLSTSTIGPISIAQSSNYTTQVVESWNAGDGVLAPALRSSVTWLNPSAGASRACTTRGGTCIPVNIAFNTAALAKGSYTGMITVSAPNALDAPQVITVTVAIGGGVPDRIDLYAAPSGSASARISTNQLLVPTVRTDATPKWLAVASEGSGTYAFGVTYAVNANSGSLAEGAHQGSFEFKGSSFGGDNKVVPVTLRVTSQPILDLSPQRFRVTLPANTPKKDYGLQFISRGATKAVVSGVTVATASGGNWLTAGAVSEGGVNITLNPAEMPSGVYQGSVTVASNAVNGASQVVPVELEIVQQGPPIASYRGAVSNATFNPDEAVAPGDIMAVFGEQFSYKDNPLWVNELPLATAQGGTRVLVNGAAAPLYYASFYQVNFQLPFETPAGQAVVQVERDGQVSNSITVQVKERAPHILPWGQWAIAFVGDVLALPRGMAGGSRPALRGEYLVIYCTGLGLTNPAVASGAASPWTEPLGRVPQQVMVGFGHRVLGSAVMANAEFQGLTPYYVGLYQVNVRVPNNAPKGNTPIYLDFGNGTMSNEVLVAIE